MLHALQWIASTLAIITSTIIYHVGSILIGWKYAWLKKRHALARKHTKL